MIHPTLISNQVFQFMQSHYTRDFGAFRDNFLLHTLCRYTRLLDLCIVFGNTIVWHTMFSAFKSDFLPCSHLSGSSLSHKATYNHDLCWYNDIFVRPNPSRHSCAYDSYIFENLSCIAFADATNSSSCFSSCSNEAFLISVSLITFVLLANSCFSWAWALRTGSRS